MPVPQESYKEYFLMIHPEYHPRGASICLFLHKVILEKASRHSITSNEWEEAPVVPDLPLLMV